MMDGVPVTTAADIEHDLRASLRTRGIPHGLTWGDFKAAMATLGIDDRTPLLSIEVGVSQFGGGRIVFDGDLTDGVEIKEISSYGGTK